MRDRGGKLEWVQWRAMKVTKELEHITCKEMLRVLALFSLEESSLRGI